MRKERYGKIWFIDAKTIKNNKKLPITFQNLIFNLQKFWDKYGCVVLQPYDLEIGAGTFHPATTLRSLGPKPWKAAYVQPQEDQQTEDMEKINRLQHYYQYQVIIKPSPKNIKQVYPKSLAAIEFNQNITILDLSKIGKVLLWVLQDRLGSL